MIVQPLKPLTQFALLFRRTGVYGQPGGAARRKLLQQLIGPGPVLRASLIQRFTQCGKVGCKGVRGTRKGPTSYLTVSHAKGWTRQVYVPKDHLPLAERWVRNYHQALTVLEKISSTNLELMRLREALPNPSEESPEKSRRFLIRRKVDVPARSRHAATFMCSEQEAFDFFVSLWNFHPLASR